MNPLASRSFEHEYLSAITQRSAPSW